MKELNNLVKFESETGETVELILLKKFKSNGNNYAILMDSNECNCGNECDCNDNCDCNEKCECENDCDCGDECECGCNCENGLYIFKITKDKDNKELYISIEDEKELDTVIKEADKVLNEE